MLEEFAGIGDVVKELREFHEVVEVLKGNTDQAASAIAKATLAHIKSQLDSLITNPPARRTAPPAPAVAVSSKPKKPMPTPRQTRAAAARAAQQATAPARRERRAPVRDRSRSLTGATRRAGRAEEPHWRRRREIEAAHEAGGCDEACHAQPAGLEGRLEDPR